jgi:fatty acid-binding protein DegV
VATVAREAVRRVRLVAAVEDLHRLVEGGRVPGIAGWAGRVLGVTPLFEFREGSVHRLAPAHGRERAVSTLIRRLSAHRSGLLHAAVLHANDPDGAADLVERVRKVGDPATLFVGEFSPVMVAHTGPLLGVAWRYES